jgi:membrane-bound lytic murein transglycosylase MltF
LLTPHIKPVFDRLFVSALLIFSFPATSLAEAGDATSMGKALENLIVDRTTDPIAKNHRAIRVLVSYNATNYFVVKSQQKGLEYELMENFAKDLNKHHKRADKKRHMIYISVPFNQLIPSLLAGKGDIIAAGLTVTPWRAKKLGFTNPYRTGISEVVVRSEKAAPLENAEQLSGKTVHVMRGSSYADHLRDLNSRLKKKKRKPVKIIEADKSLASEDLLQMVNAGVYQYTIVDSHIAELWAPLLEGVTIEPAAVINENGKIAWAVRKENKQLLNKLNTFVKKHRQGTMMGNVLFNRYYKDTKWIVNPLTESTMKRIQRYQDAFQKYGDDYGIAWIMLTAQGFQESRLDQSKVSRAGAVGVMQIKPSTAADKNVGITGVRKDSDKNIHAAIKYLDFIRSRYFSDPGITPVDQIALSLAAYNAGPARIASMRKKTKQAGLNPNVWFNNVEQITRKHVGSEPVNYVANIVKYYIAFKTTLDTAMQRMEATEKLR